MVNTKKGVRSMQAKIIIGISIIAVIAGFFGLWRLSEAKNAVLMQEINTLKVAIEIQDTALEEIKNDMTIIQSEYNAYVVESTKNAQESREAIKKLDNKVTDALEEPSGDTLSDILNDILEEVDQ